MLEKHINNSDKVISFYKSDFVDEELSTKVKVSVEFTEEDPL